MAFSRPTSHRSPSTKSNPYEGKTLASTSASHAMLSAPFSANKFKSLSPVSLTHFSCLFTPSFSASSPLLETRERKKERKNTLLMNCFSSRLDMSPFSEQTETSLTVQAGEAAVMEVAAVESQPKPAVTWEAEDGSPLYGHKYALGPDSQLVILSVSESDQKLYR